MRAKKSSEKKLLVKTYCFKNWHLSSYIQQETENLKILESTAENRRPLRKIGRSRALTDVPLLGPGIALESEKRNSSFCTSRAYLALRNGSQCANLGLPLLVEHEREFFKSSCVLNRAGDRQEYKSIRGKYEQEVLESKL